MEGQPQREGVKAPKRRSVPWEEVSPLLHNEQVHQDEYERRFEVAHVTPELLGLLQSAQYRVMSQGYFDATDKEGGEERRYRLRPRASWDAETGERYIVNQKKQREQNSVGKESRETEWEIAAEEFRQAWEYTYDLESDHASRITKVRFYVTVNEREIELDVFLEPQEICGLVVAEVEFKKPDGMHAFNPQTEGIQWLGKDISDVKELSNAKLATHGLPGTDTYAPNTFQGKEELIALAQERLRARMQSSESVFALA